MLLGFHTRQVLIIFQTRRQFCFLFCYPLAVKLRFSVFLVLIFFVTEWITRPRALCGGSGDDPAPLECHKLLIHCATPFRLPSTHGEHALRVIVPLALTRELMKVNI